MNELHSKILLDEDCAHIIVGGQAERALAYDDAAGWSAFKANLIGEQTVTAMVPTTSTLSMAMPTRPRSRADLRAMLEMSAPLAPRDLLWTYPFPRDDGAAKAVTLVKRDWLDPRLAAIRRQLASIDLLVVDENHEPFLPRSSPVLQSLRLVPSLAAVVIVLGTAFAWQFTSVPPRRPSVAQTKAPAIIKAAPAIVAAVKPIPVKPGKTELILLGIAGRLPDDADVLVKTPWGRTTTMRMGDTLLGWKLVAVAPNKIALEKDGAHDELVLEPAA